MATRTGGYLWNPELERQTRQRELVQSRGRDRARGIQTRPPSLLTDAATGKRTQMPGGRERVVDASLPPEPKGGLAAMLAEQGGDEELIKTAQEIESMPGGAEMLYTYTAEQMMRGAGAPKGALKNLKKLRLFNLGDEREAKAHYARGGSTKQAAQRTRRAGRGDDSMLLHVSPEEYEALTGMWGKPDTNPNTGIPEYGFLSKLWKKVKKGVKKIVKSKIFQIVAPIALSIFVPGLGAAIGTLMTGGGTAAAGAALAAGGAGTGLAASAIGNAVVQGGLGAAAGGKEGFVKGALSGAVTGGLGRAAGEAAGLTGKTADIAGSSVLEGVGSVAAGGDFTEGALSGALNTASKGMQQNLADDARGALGLSDQGGLFGPRPSTAPVQTTDALGQTVDAPAMAPTSDRPLTSEEMLAATADPSGRVARTASPITSPVPASKPTLGELATKYGIPAVKAYGAIAGGGEGAYTGEAPELPPEFTQSLEQLPAMNRQFQGPNDPSSYFTYGQAGSPTRGQHLFLDPEPFSSRPPGPAGGLEGAVGAAGSQRPVPVPPGRAGFAQRQQMEQQGWTFNPGTQMMHPPSGPVNTGATNFVARGGYMAGGQADYWAQNDDVFTTAPYVSARGNYVKGEGTGRSDEIDARLSDGEYVIDAESVALLGDGSGDAGAKRLDEMRANLRKHKGKNLKKGEFSHKAKKPEGYMRNMKKLERKARYEHGGVHNVANGGTI